MTKVYLAVGHGEKPDGRHDPGATGGGWTEQTAGDVIVAEAARRLRDAGVTVHSEANRDDPAFEGTVKNANAWGADLVVSVHHDWSGAPDGAFGHWVSDEGKRLADSIRQSVRKAKFPLRDDWHRERGDLYLLNQTQAPAVLYEVGRIGQPELDSEAGLRRMGRAVADGIAGHVGATLEEDDPMATLDDEDIDRIAEAVWRYRIGHGADLNASTLLSRLQGGGIDDVLAGQVDADELAKQLAARLRE